MDYDFFGVYVRSLRRRLKLLVSVRSFPDPWGVIVGKFRDVSGDGGCIRRAGLRVAVGSDDAVRVRSRSVSGVPVPECARFELYGHRLEIRRWPAGTIDPGEPGAVMRHGAWWHVRVL